MPVDRRIERQTGLRLTLEAEGLDGLVITHLPNIRYLTGFTGSAAVLLVRNDATVLVSDFRY
ncbi:MAG TPA: aminopeptidase P family N-terminal domain-containing protein, partial [Gemmatimonadales bacterium]|nr:aminopeptidase P family N-terminal domain-containing protein [Gemmatimonadales bacterium]